MLTVLYPLSHITVGTTIGNGVCVTGGLVGVGSRIVKRDVLLAGIVACLTCQCNRLNKL